MNSFVSSLLATGAVAAVGFVVLGFPDIEPGIAHDEITGSVKGDRQGSFILVRGDETRCPVRRGARISPTVYRVDTTQACAAVLAGFDTALFWTDTANGGVVISGPKGPIIEFADTDGGGLESVTPQRPLFSLELDISRGD